MLNHNYIEKNYLEDEYIETIAEKVYKWGLIKK